MAGDVRVSAPSRLHFGLLRFANPGGRSFGGLGAMVSQPRVEVCVSHSRTWSATGPAAERALEFAQLAAAATPGAAGCCFSVAVLNLPLQHSGLGVGTQLALATAAGISAACNQPPPATAELATRVGRGRRSAVGSYGFVHGGLIFEDGFLPGESVGRLASRTALPDRWRFVLLRPPSSAGKSGGDEQAAFARLPPVASSVTDALVRLATEQIVPAAARDDFANFSKSLYEYGRLAGECFATAQGGPFASPEIAAAVEQLRGMGIAGVGQSSWGPTVFAVLPDAPSADALVRSCACDSLLKTAKSTIASPDNQGAAITP